ncbi:MAG TPA: hypothetical protein DIW31_02750 [Bacteroidales bacterium]|nr:hypothetical protein [Bacteroidales bacterium]
MNLSTTAKGKEYLILFFIIVVAIVLRFLHPFDIPFTHDEHSALFRINYTSFKDLIEFGVKPDGHPAGIQVLLYFWTILFGYSEIAVKIPFLFLGVFSVFLIYKIGKQWYNSTVGLVSASFLSTLEYFVTYSQIARPYISGLFFTLLMVFFWIKIIKQPQKRVLINAGGYIGGSILCSYNHYFSLLFAVIVGITGLFLIERKFIKRYILFGLIIFIAFIPHIGITIGHLRMGGIEGWLGKPHYDFLIEYLKFAFNNSVLILILVLSIIVFGFYKREFASNYFRHSVIVFCWFILPFLIGFLYSIFVNAVLQYSMLIFSFPFFILLIFGHLPVLSYKYKWLLITVILSITSFSLIVERKHYSYFYNLSYEKILTHHDSLKRAKCDFISIVDSDKKISKYYVEKLSLDTSFIWADSFTSLVDFKSFIRKQNKPNLYFGCISWSNPTIIPIIQDYYPYIEWQKNYFTGTAYLFKKQKTENSQKPIYTSIMTFEGEEKNWRIERKEKVVDTMGYESCSSYLFDSTGESGPTFTIPLKEIINNQNNFIDVSLYTRMDEFPEDVLLCSSLESRGKNIDWRSTSFDTFVPKINYDKVWTKIYHTIKLSDIYLKYPDVILKVGVWNRKKQRFYIDNFEIKVRKGNTVIYGL